jgi:hypothetical protein
MYQREPPALRHTVRPGDKVLLEALDKQKLDRVPLLPVRPLHTRHDPARLGGNAVAG